MTSAHRPPNTAYTSPDYPPDAPRSDTHVRAAGAVSAFMTQCLMIPFTRVGVFMLVSIGFSALVSLVFFPISLALCASLASYR